MIIAYIDRANLSVAVALPDFKKQFNLDDFQKGLLTSSFFWSYALLQIPAGFLVDRYGVKYPYAIAFFFWSLMSAATSFVSTAWQIIGLRMMLGVGESLVTPASMRWIRFNVAERQRGLAVGIYMAGTKYGPAIGVPLAAYLAKDFGWQQMFLILGFGSLLWLIPWMFMVKNDDKQLESAALVRSGKPAMAFRQVWKTPLIYGVIIGTFAYNYFVFFCMTWLPSYFREYRNFSLEKMGSYTFFSFSGMATVAILAGFAADKLIDQGWDPLRVRKGFTLAGLIIASTEIFGIVATSPEMSAYIFIFSLSGLGLATANYWALTQLLIPGAAAGRIAGVQNFASNIAGAIASAFTGYLIKVSGNYNAPMIAIWLFLVAGITAYIFMVQRKYALKVQDA